MKSSYNLCISISARSVELLLEKAKEARRYKPEVLEFRLDYIKALDPEKLARVGNMLSDKEILTLRAHDEGGMSDLPERRRVFLIREGLLPLEPRFVDIEISTLAKHPEMVSELERTKTNLIASFHDLKGKSTIDQIHKMILRAPVESPSLYAVKIARKAIKIEDNETILSLYSKKIFEKSKIRLIAFCTGKKGIKSRISCLRAGSPLSYCSLPGEPLAPGQFDINRMRELLSKSPPS